MNFIYIFVIGSFFAIVGDYFFSYLKRKSDIKDTGSILPGHGGILDRIDSYIAAITIMIFLTFYFIKMKKIFLFGATGSIGESSLNVIKENPDHFAYLGFHLIKILLG